jgi:DNA-binding NtrC family response regulator
MSTKHAFTTYTQSSDHPGELASKTAVLLVEDDDAVREFVRAVLEHVGYSVVAATHGEQGFAEFIADPDRFALIISDVVMPNKTGPELIEAIRRIRPEVRVIFMSAYTGGLSSAPAEISPGEILLEKPFSLDQLLHTVALMVGSKK